MDNVRPTVFVIDDDASVRKSLARLLRSEGFAVEALESADEFLARYLRERPGCIVLDFQMPGLDGLELQSRLKEVDCELPVVFISGHGDVPCSVRAMKEGAVDFLTKPFEDEQLLAAVRRALERDRTQRAMRREREDVDGRLALLTPREREVFRHIVLGMLNKEVAEQMGISEKTVKVHRARVMEKMEADSLAELVRLAGKLGM
jgi:RNA polymerase sigma factor (sigma-70 family)